MAKLTREQAKAALDKLTEDLAGQFGDRLSEDRLAQARFHLDTAGMAVDHLFEEHERREAEKDERIRRIQAGEEA